MRAGDHVTALWQGSPYPAVILETRDSLVRARWDDWSEQWVDLADVRSVEGRATGAVRGCAHQSVLVDEGPRLHVGRVLACDEATATVIDASSTPQTLPRTTLRRVPLRVGDAIDVRLERRALRGDSARDRSAPAHPLVRRHRRRRRSCGRDGVSRAGPANE